MTPFHLQSFAQLTAGRMINCVVEGLAIALVASILLRLTSRNSGTRFGVWFSTLLAIAGLAVFAFTSPSLSAAPASMHAAQIVLPGSWALAAITLWAGGVLVGLFRMAVALAQVWRLHRHSTLLPLHDLDPQVRKTVQEFCPTRRVEVRVTDELRVPTAVGFFRPAVLIPRWAMTELSADELNAVLLHELGHLRRWDDWTNLTQKLLRVLLFFHPAVWWIDSRLSLERESACDDLVVSRTANARAYAECLVSVAEKSFLRTGMALALAAVSRVRQTAIRLGRILDGRRSIDTRVSKPAIAAVSIVGLAALAVLPQAPELVVFQDNHMPAHVAPVAYSSLKTPGAYRPSSSPHIVQAVLHEDAARGTVLASASVPSKLVSRPKTERIQKRTIRHSPMVVRTSAVDDQPVRPTLLFVVETDQFGADGAMVSNVRVWTLTVIRQQGPTQSQKGNGWKAI